MSTRSCREKAQKQNEQHQAILAKLLREEDNKYCADCEAKGPRWASWNTGVFICIRCAGIHRNLGVHISRVKSVNLDQWTPEQIQCMQEMGNTKARLLYEANLPENFRRPQTDQAVEFFIRDKYEKKKYYDKNATHVTSEKDKKKEERKRDKEPEKPLKNLGIEKPQKKDDQQLELKTSPKKVPESTVDLLGLDGPADASVTNGSTITPAPVLNDDDLDIFGPMISNPLPAASVPSAQNASTNPAAATLSAASGDLDLFTEQTKSEESAKKLLSKDSILSLYGAGTLPQQNVPGVFMGAQPLPFAAQPPAHFPAFPAMGGPVPVPVPVPTAPAMMGNLMAPPVPVLGQNVGMMVGIGMPNGFSVTTQTAGLGLPQSIGGSQGTVLGQIPQPQKYGMQPQAQQTQWNVSQMNQQMAGMTLNSSNNMMGFGQPPNTVAGWTGTSSGQTLSTQLWK
ncbi:stromal membrane-associated protein 1 isoform X2 [Thamnophis elegans]|uniref:stromal membrane-associated protein 1 isoform X2 n=1 Tax=Thamnophis elegans TaxID=35005 RepID=UPI001377E367|nr:stromal membrane-associated protein 1 isoform X2 [Thamnophis elegans]